MLKISYIHLYGVFDGKKKIKSAPQTVKLSFYIEILEKSKMFSIP